MLDAKTCAWMDENGYDPSAINRVGKYGNSALMKAARVGDPLLVEALIGAGASLEIRNIDGNTALWNGCFGENFACVSHLVKAGIDLNAQNDNGVTALMYCASSGKEEMTALLLQHGANTLLENLDGFRAIDLAATPTIYRLLKKGD